MAALPSVVGAQSDKTAALIETEREKNYQQNVSERKPMQAY